VDLLRKEGELMGYRKIGRSGLLVSELCVGIEEIGERHLLRPGARERT
jgi:aryl-alcohol dehydrogenase-like predicted oxidoreductase